MIEPVYPWVYWYSLLQIFLGRNAYGFVTTTGKDPKFMHFCDVKKVSRKGDCSRDAAVAFNMDSSLDMSGAAWWG